MTGFFPMKKIDFEKYLLGHSGGENGTGYIRDPETNHAVSAPCESLFF